QLPVSLSGGTFNLGGGSQIVTYEDETRDTTTGSITAGSKTLTVADEGVVVEGQRIRIAGAGPSGAALTTMATAVSETTVTLRDAAGTTVSGADTHTYSTVNYVQHGLGFGFLQYGIKYPGGSLSRYTVDEFLGVSSFGMRARGA